MLRVEDLSFGYQGRPVLEKVSFSLSPGTITCLTGGNGSGKTTLFNLVTGFLKPQSGSVHLGTKRISGLAPHAIGRMGLARTFQDLRLVDTLSVRDNLLLASSGPAEERLWVALFQPRASQRYRRSQTHVIDKLLEEYHLDTVASNLASNISYGQQKLLVLACCAIRKPKILLLDEPIAGVSIANRAMIGDRIRSLQREGATILVIEHQRDFLSDVGERFFHIADKRLVEYGTLGEVLNVMRSFRVSN